MLTHEYVLMNGEVVINSDWHIDVQGKFVFTPKVRLVEMAVLKADDGFTFAVTEQEAGVMPAINSCGNCTSDLNQVSIVEQDPGYFIVCDVCGAQTDVYSRVTTAILVWNDKVQVTVYEK